MPIKPKQRELRDNNILEPKDFDKEYDGLKGLLNNGLDRQNLPVTGIDASAFRNNSFCSYYQQYWKMDEAVVSSPDSERSNGVLNFDEMPAQTYNSYAGGWFESSNPLVVENLREGMCQVEMNLTYIMNKLNLAGYATAVKSPAPSIVKADLGYCQFHITYNGSVIADTGKISRNLQTIHLCASIPVATGKGEFNIAWRFNGRRQDLVNYPMDAGYFYWTGGDMLVINYYR